MGLDAEEAGSRRAEPIVEYWRVYLFTYLFSGEFIEKECSPVIRV